MKISLLVVGLLLGGTVTGALGASERAEAGAASVEPPVEHYGLGPGGGDVSFDPNGPPPLESTGLEDGVGGCNCSFATEGGRASISLGLAALGLLAGRARRRAAARPRAQ